MSNNIYKLFKVFVLLKIVLVVVFCVTSISTEATAPNTICADGSTVSPGKACPVTKTSPANPATPTPADPKSSAAPAKTGETPRNIELPTSPKGNSKLVLNDCPGQITTLTITSLLQPTNFVPLIPDSCSGGTTAPEALSLKAIPVIIVRIYGLLASLVFFLTGFNLIFASVRYSYGAFQESEAKNAINSIQESATSVLLVVVAHLIVSTIFSTIFKIPLNTEVTYIQSFFN